jgi:hypothetical protein
MADRIIKSDSGNDVVIQNNAGSRKIEVTNSGDVEVTGDVKTTTVKATNLKANDGTASLEIADSTGDIGFSGNTNLKIKLPSAGGIYESDGSTEIITESGGTVTLKNITIDSNVIFPAGGTGNPISVAVILDERDPTDDGGDFNSGAWRTRNLNFEDDPYSIVSVASNQFTLGAGTYRISWSAPAFIVNQHQTLLYSITNTANLSEGSSEFASSGDSILNRSFGSYIHTPTASHTYEIRHQCATTRATNGFGVASNFGVSTVYTIVLIEKLK